MQKLNYHNENNDINNILGINEKFENDEIDLDMDWSNFDTEEDIHVDSCSDGLVYSLKNKGCVDLEYISKITGLDYDTIIKKLKGSIYQDPALWNESKYEGFVTSDEYLSGNILKKYEIAREANVKYHGYFKDNMKALSEIRPNHISYDDIFYTLSSPWIPYEVIKRFVVKLFELTGYHATNKYLKHVLRHDTITGMWEVKIENYLIDYSKVSLKYGTYRMYAKTLLEKLLNGKTVVVYNTITMPDGKTKPVINKAETVLAEQKAKELEQEFKNFVESDKEVKDLLNNAYNDKFGFFIPRVYDGSFLEFPNMNKKVTIYDYQRSAIARIIFNRNTLLSHNVGAGKTYVMIASGEELLRMNLSSKNLYVVPNNIVGQWKNIYKDLYPNRNVFVIKPSMFEKDKRKDTLNKIQDENTEVIIMPYSVFDRIKLSKDARREILKKKIEEIDLEMENNGSYTNIVYKLKESYKKDLEKLEEEIESVELPFDKLNITRLYLDEAHNYKNVPFTTNIGYVRGINSEGSRKCSHMMDICSYINGNLDNGIIMATGTPITNSITDAFIFQSYLQKGELKLLNINTFDKWVSMFAERTDDLEVDVDTSNYRVVTRFSKFHNLLQLTAIFSNIADFYYSLDTKDLPIFNGYSDVVVPKNEDLKEYIKDLSTRVEAIRNFAVSRKDDNMLKVTTDGRKAALDLRLINEELYSNYHMGKIFYCAEEVSKIYFETKEENLTQLVFCDISTPKDTFNAYDELKKYLITFGVEENDIAYIHDATTDKKRDELFKAMNDGAIRILIGSTQKLGLGVNVQDKLYAIHHLDIPWRPADMVQREGRIIRPGNKNERVYIYRYIAEGSFDAYSWQLLETKQKFINELLSNSLNEQTKDDVNDTVLSYAEVKSLAIDNPLLKDLIATRNEINRYRMLNQKSIERKAKLKTRSLEIPGKVKELKEYISNLKLDIELYNKSKIDYPKETRQHITKTISEGLNNHLGCDDELVVYNYQGFDIIALSHMLDNHLALKIKGNGSYYLQLGTSEKGIIIRIDNYLSNLEKLLQKAQDDKAKLVKEGKSIETELNNDDIDYSIVLDYLVEKAKEIEEEMSK